MELLPRNATVNLHLQSSITVSVLSTLTFALLAILLLLHTRGEEGGRAHAHLNRAGNLIVLFLGVLINVITTLSVPKTDDHIYTSYNVSIQIMVGIILTVFGCQVFFEPPRWREEGLGYHHRNISLLIWVITIPLVVMELMQAIGAITVKVDKYKALMFFTGLIQKLVQANIYHFNLRYKTARADRKMGASFYLKIMSLFNFVMWLDSIMTSEKGNEFIAQMLSGGNNKTAVVTSKHRIVKIVGNTSDALLIDYHLLCCLLFAEHAIEIDSSSDTKQEEEPEDENMFHHPDMEFHIGSSMMSGLGYTFGVSCIVLQLVCGLQYFSYVPVWSNIFPCMADISVIVLGFWLLKLAGRLHSGSGTSGMWRETNSKGVDIMVAMMGVTGFLFWIILSIFNATWAYTITHAQHQQLNTDTIGQVVQLLKWNCAKNVLRSLGILFQLYFYMKSDPHIGCTRMRNEKYSYFVLPGLMLSLLSVFLMAVIDSRSEVVEKLMDDSHINPALRILLTAGEPLYLGFSLHMFLHFFIINNNMKRRNRGRVNEYRGVTQMEITNRRDRSGSCPARPQKTLSVRYEREGDQLMEPLLNA